MAEPLSGLLADESVHAPAANLMFAQMMRDVSNGGGAADPVEQACYALGYNLAVEYLAHPEKTGLLEAFRRFHARVLAPLGRELAWEFLVVHAEGECEHAAMTFSCRVTS